MGRVGVLAGVVVAGIVPIAGVGPPPAGSGHELGAVGVEGRDADRLVRRKIRKNTRGTVPIPVGMQAGIDVGMHPR